MNTEEFKRKLTAILSADVEGYSRLMRDDEEATIRTLTTYRTAMTGLIQQYRGRVVDSPGDNILAEFTSAVDAVNCAVEMQRELAERNAELPESRRMEFRIGVNVGDVVEEGERIYGDGVNIAARMEGLAEGGGTCISGTAYDQVKHKLGLEYEYLGEQEIKNITEPVPAYRVLSFPGAAAHRVVKAKKAMKRAWRNMVLTIVAVLVVGTVAAAVWNLFLRPSSPPTEVASVEKMAFPLPDKPSIAVLPFTNMSGDPEQEYIADGISENIISALSKIPKVFVIARNSTFTYKGKRVKVQQVAEELGVQYVLEGGVQKSGDRLRVTAQLIDAITGRHIWSEKYDRGMRDLFPLQDEITKKIVVALQVELTEGEAARIRHRITDNLEAWGWAVKGLSLFECVTKEDNAKARELFERAVDLDPEYAWAWTMLAWTHFQDGRFGWSQFRWESLRRAFVLTQKALAMDDTLPGVHFLQAHYWLFRREYDEAYDRAVEECEKGIALAPTAADSHYNFGWILLYIGRPEQALPLIKKAMRLHPYYPPHYLEALGEAYVATGRYDKALATFQQLLDRSHKGEYNPILAHVHLAGVYLVLGQEAQARAHVAEVLNTDPNFSMTRLRVLELAYFRDPARLERLLEAMRKAGPK